MNREDAKKDLHYGIQFGTLRINEFINKIYDNFEKQLESVQEENISCNGCQYEKFDNKRCNDCCECQRAYDDNYMEKE